MKLLAILLAGLSLTACTSKETAKEATALSSKVSGPVTTPTVPPAKSRYQTYAGCEVPATSFKRVVEVMPGKAVPTLAAGDKLVLKKGEHAGFKVTGPGSNWVQIDFEKGASAKYIETAGSKILVTNAVLTGPGRLANLFNTSSGSDVVLADSKIGFSDASKWTADQWMKAPSGISSDNTRCISILRNELQNLRMGITLFVRGQVVGQARPHDVKGLIQGNKLDGISGDFIRPLGGMIDVIGNVATNGKLSGEKNDEAPIDENHDDFIQMFAQPVGVIYENVRILKNRFQETTGPEQKFKSVYQGISIFDGYYKNIEVSDNVVLASAWHLIALYGAENAVINNNTVANIHTSGTRRGWIQTPATKGGVPSKNVTAKNNIAHYFSFPAGSKLENNREVRLSDVTKAFTVWDMVNYKFDLTPKPGGPLDK